MLQGASLVFLELGHCNFRNILDVPSVDIFPYTFPFMFLVNLFAPSASSSWSVKQLQLVIFDRSSGETLSTGQAQDQVKPWGALNFLKGPHQ